MEVMPIFNNKKASMIQVYVIDPYAREPVVPDTRSIYETNCTKELSSWTIVHENKQHVFSKIRRIN